MVAILQSAGGEIAHALVFLACHHRGFRKEDQRTAYLYGDIGLALTLVYHGGKFRCCGDIVAESLDIDDA